MKKTISTIVVLVILVSFNFIQVNADVIPVFYNGERLVFDVDPVVIDDRTMVPMRTIFETFGATVTYNPETKQITGIKGNLKIILNVGHTYATVSRSGVITEYTLDSPPRIVDGRTVVPLRFIGEALGAVVNWNPANRTVTIISSVTAETTTKTVNSKTMTATEIAKHMEQRSVILICYNNSGQRISQGSGFFIDSNGHIVTNHHVIKGAVRAVAKLNDGSEHEVIAIVHRDEGRDLVVLKINKTNTPYVSLGKSDLVETGNKIYAYGSPLGISNTLSEGIVSNKNVVLSGYSYIQISAPVSPGSSGGAVVDENGYAVGIVCSYLIDGQNMNLAIPANDLKALLNKTPVNIQLESLPAGFDIPRTTFYEVEPNNSTAFAQQIGLNCYVSGVYGSAYSTSDLDYYKINVTESGWLEIIGIWSSESFRNMIYTEDLLIGVQDINENYVAIAKDERGSVLESYKSVYVYLNPGTYYIIVTARYDYRHLYANEHYYFGVWFK